MALLVPFLGQAHAQLPGWTESFDPTTGKIEVDPLRNWGLYHVSDTISLKTSDGSSVRVFNVRGTTVYQGSPGVLPPLPVGHYFVECPGDRTQFVVLPDDYQGASFFGTEADNGGNQPNTDILALVKPGYTRVMGGGGFWSEIQGAGPTAWDWAPLDRTLSFSAGRKIIIMGMQRPWWQTNDDQFVSAYTTYVKAVAKRYGDKVTAIEIWNELAYGVPWAAQIPASSPSASLTNYIQLATAARKAVRSVNRTIEIWGPAWSGEWNNVHGLDQFTAAGGLTPFDAYSWHHYDPINPPDSESIYFRTDERFDFITQHTGALGLAVDEVGLYGASALGIPPSGPYVSDPPMDWHRGLCRAIKEMVMPIGGGVSAYIPHVFILSPPSLDYAMEIYGWDSGSTNGYKQARGPHPKTSATLMTCYWLNGATLIGRRAIADKVFLYAWQRPSGERVIFAWSLEGQPVTIHLDGTENVTDIFGRPVTVTQLTEEPVLFHDTSTTDVCSLLDGIQAKLYRGDVNRAPVLAPIPDQGVFEGYTVSFLVTAADPDNDPSTYSASGLPPGATFDPMTRRFAWTPTAAQIGAWPITFNVSDGLASTSQVVAVNVYSTTPPGLIAYWKFNDGTGTVAADSAGNDPASLLYFTFNMASGWVDTERGTALEFDGKGEFVSVDNSSYQVIPSGNSAFSISLWFNADNLTTPTGKSIMLNEPDHSSGFRYAVYTTGQLYFWSSEDSGNLDLLSSTVLATGTWYHAVVSYTGNSGAMYINGALVASDPTGTVISSAAPLLIGRAIGGEEPFNGMMSDVMVFNHALSAQEVQALYQGTRVAEPPAANSAPVWTITPPQTAQRNRTLTFTVAASDPDGDPLTYSASGLPLGASFDQTTQTIRWTPTVGQNGAYAITFLVSDGLATATQVVAIAVNGSAAAPIMTRIKPKPVKAGHPLRLRLKAKSPLKKPVTYLVMSLPTGASFKPQSGQFLWTPDATQIGNHTVTFIATDGRFTDTQSVTLTVLAP